MFSSSFLEVLRFSFFSFSSWGRGGGNPNCVGWRGTANPKTKKESQPGPQPGRLALTLSPFLGWCCFPPLQKGSKSRSSRSSPSTRWCCVFFSFFFFGGAAVTLPFFPHGVGVRQRELQYLEGRSSPRPRRTAPRKINRNPFFLGWCCFPSSIWVVLSFPSPFQCVVLLFFLLLFGSCCRFPFSFCFPPWCWGWLFPIDLPSGDWFDTKGKAARSSQERRRKKTNPNFLWVVLLAPSFREVLPLFSSCQAVPSGGWVVLLVHSPSARCCLPSLLGRAAFLLVHWDGAAFSLSSVGWCSLVRSFFWSVLLFQSSFRWFCLPSLLWVLLRGAAWPLPSLGGVAFLLSFLSGACQLPFLLGVWVGLPSSFSFLLGVP